MSVRHLTPYLSLLFFGLATALFYHWYQPAIDYKTNILADANGYEKIYNFFQGDPTPYSVRFGIHNRIMVPFLASLIPGHDIEFGFFIINTIFALCSLLAIYHLFCYFQIKKQYIYLMLCFFVFHWVGPFRQNAIDPINVDMAVYGFEVLFLIFFLRKKFMSLLIIAPIAIATKELFLAIIIVFWVISMIQHIYFKSNLLPISWMTAILLAGIITKLALPQYFPSNAPGRTSLLVMAFHVRELIINPDHIARWFLALFAAYGAFIFLILNKGTQWKSSDDNAWVVHILSLSVLALSVIGGMDYTRLIFLGFPYVMLSFLLISRPKNNFNLINKYEFFMVFGLSFLLTRPWAILPDPLQNMSLYNKWMPQVADTMHLIYWAIVAIAYFIIWRLGNKLFGKWTNAHPVPE